MKLRHGNATELTFAITIKRIIIPSNNHETSLKGHPEDSV